MGALGWARSIPVMASNTAYTENRKDPAASIGGLKHAFTPSRTLIAAVWVAGVLLMLGAIANVAQEQVRKGMNLHGQGLSAPQAAAGQSGSDTAEATQVSAGTAASLTKTAYGQ